MLSETDIDQIYLVGDLHLGIRNNSILWSDIQTDYLLKTFFEQIATSGHNPKKSILILEGDIFHSRQSIDARIFSIAIQLFEKFSKKFKSVYIILGNHDLYYKESSTISSVFFFSQLYKNVHSLAEPDVLKVNNHHTFLLLPWSSSNDHLTEVIEEHSGKCQNIISHADYVGARLNKHTKIEHGISPKVLSSYSRVFSGHIHLRQEIKKYGANILYTGTPYSMDKADTGNEKGFEILNLVGDALVETFVPNTASPVFVKKNLYSILEMTVSELNALFKNNFVEILISSDIFARFSPTSFMDLIKDSQYKKIEFSKYIKSIEMDSSEIVKGAEDSNMSLLEMKDRYLEQKQYDHVMKQSINRKILEFYDKVQENAKVEL